MPATVVGPAVPRRARTRSTRGWPAVSDRVVLLVAGVPVDLRPPSREWSARERPDWRRAQALGAGVIERSSCDRISRAMAIPDDGAREAALRAAAAPDQARRVRSGGSRSCRSGCAGVQGAARPGRSSASRVVIFAGDHGVAPSGVSAYPPEVTAQMVRNFVAGGAAVNVLARLAGASVRVLDLVASTPTCPTCPGVSAYKVRRGSGDIDCEDRR